MTVESFRRDDLGEKICLVSEDLRQKGTSRMGENRERGRKTSEHISDAEKTDAEKELEDGEGPS